MHNNNSVNFSLKGFTSILVGVYFLIAAYVIKFILDGFLIDDNTMGMLSVEIVEVLIMAIVLILFLFSSLALYFSGKRDVKKNKTKLWNDKTKSTFWKYLICNVVIFISLIILINLGFIDFVTPTFLVFFGFLLFVFKNKDRKNILILSGLSLLLGFLCILIPTYWSSSISILGISLIAYGVVVK